MTDREKAGLRGPVKICAADHTMYYRPSVCGPEGCRPGEIEERRFRTVSEYDSAGKLIRQTHRNPDGSEHTWECQTDIAQGPHETITHRDGRKVKVMRVPPDIVARGDVMFGHHIEGSDASYSARGTSTIETIYNEQDRPGEVRFLERRGRCLGRVSFVYDGQGRLVEEHQFVTGRGRPFSFRILELILAVGQRRFPRRAPLSSRYHRYDDSGRRVETRLRVGPLGCDRQSFEYNEHGDKISEVTEHQSREATLDWRLRLRTLSERQHRSEARMEYRYDERGNWIEQSVYGRSTPDRPYELSSTYRRTIEYHS